MRMPAGLHVKISAGDQLLGPRASLSIDHGEDIVVFVGMDKHHPALVRRHSRGGGIAKTRRNGCGRANRQWLTVQATASFHKIDLATGHTKIPTTISHPRPYGELVSSRAAPRLLVASTPARRGLSVLLTRPASRHHCPRRHPRGAGLRRGSVALSGLGQRPYCSVCLSCSMVPSGVAMGSLSSL